MRDYLALLASRISSPIGWACASGLAIAMATLALALDLQIDPNDAFVMGLFLGASLGWAIEWKVYRSRYLAAALEARDHILQLPVTLAIPHEQELQSCWAELSSHAVSPAQYFISLRELRRKVSVDLVDFYSLVAEGVVSPSTLKGIERRRHRAPKDSLRFPAVEEEDLLSVMEAESMIRERGIGQRPERDAGPRANVIRFDADQES